MPLPVSFGRSWNLLLNLTDTKTGKVQKKPFRLSLLISKEIDPASGMTVNLVTVDQWFKELDSLLSINYPKPNIFLEKAFAYFEVRNQSEGSQLLKLQMSDLLGNGCSLQRKEIFFTYRFIWKHSDLTRPQRNVDFTMAKELSELETQDLSEALAHVDDLKEAVLKDPHIVKVEVWDPFNEKIDIVISGRRKSNVY